MIVVNGDEGKNIVNYENWVKYSNAFDAIP